MYQRDLYSVADIGNLLDALATTADPTTDEGRGFIRGLVTLALAVGLPRTEQLFAQLVPGAQVRVIELHETRRLAGGGAHD